MRAVAMIIAVLIGSRVAAAETITIKVVEVAGGVAYVTPGAAAGLARGAKVRIRGRELEVFEVTEKTGALRLATGTLAVGDTGSATIVKDTAGAVATLQKPRPASAFTGQWPEAIVPATTQQPRAVPLGSGRAPGRTRVAVIGHGFGGADRSGVAGSADARVIASFELMSERPLGADLDVAGRVFSRGIDTGTYSPAYVRTAQLRYGDARAPALALGRLRYAASSVGMLDGGRAAARTGSFELAAFGGIVPDPLGGKPDPDASRFGAEVMYDDREASWQPRIALTAFGSTWQGELDERRAALVASAGRSSIWLDGWAELSQFTASNPWNARPLELTGAGGAVQWREHGTHAGVDVTFQRPERSRRLDAHLLPEWICTRTLAETCSGSDYRGTASASVGTRTARWGFDAVASLGRSHGIYRGNDRSGYLRGELAAGPGRVHVGGAAGRTDFASWTSGEGGFALPIARRFDADVAYRLDLIDYVASTGPFLVHSIVGDAHHAVTAKLDVALSAIASTGADRDAVALLATVAWRPLP